MEAVFPFQRGSLRNYESCSLYYDYNQVHGSSRSHAAGIPPRPYYLNIKPISLARHARQCSLLWAIVAMLGTDTVVCFYFTSTPVDPLWFNGHYQCPTHVSLPPTVLVARWPQQGTQRTNPLWSQNGSRTIAWHLRRSHEIAESMSYSAEGNNSEDNVFVFFYPPLDAGWINWMILFHHSNRNHTPVHRKIKHVILIRTHTCHITPYATPEGAPLYKTVY